MASLFLNLFHRPQQKQVLEHCSFLLCGSRCPCTAKPEKETYKDCGRPAKLHQPAHLRLDQPPQTTKDIIMSSDLFTTPRSETVEQLASIIDEYRIAHVRGTPTSGKITLAHLLHSYYEAKGKRVIMLFGWPRGGQEDHEEVLVNACCKEFPQAGVTKLNLLKQDIIFILDEAQQSYWDTGPWLFFIKTQSGRIEGPPMCLFSSFGSPANGPTSYLDGSAPVHLGAPQRVSVKPSPLAYSPPIGLFFTPSEYLDVVRRICVDDRLRSSLTPSAIAHLYEITSGHPGAVGGLIYYISKVCRRYIVDLKTPIDLDR